VRSKQGREILFSKTRGFRTKKIEKRFRVEEYGQYEKSKKKT
jgi:hypothetical protein